MRKGNEDLPNDVPLTVYFFVRKIIPDPIRRFAADFFLTISPDVPYELSQRLKEKQYWGVILYGILIGIIFCFLTTAVFCFFENVLFPYQCMLPSEHECSQVQYFSTDYVNIIMYTVVTPLTVGVGLALLLATISTWKDLDHILDRERSTLINKKGFIVVSLILVMSSIVISMYINDVVNTNSEIGIKANELHFWFLGDPSVENVIKPITVYYTILNYLILVFTLACVAIFVTAIRPIMKLANLLSTSSNALNQSSELLLEKLSRFADVYLFAKILLAITMLHSIVWSYSPLALTQNFNIERGFIVFVSIFFIAIPRLHFELEWYRAALIYNQKGGAIELRPTYIRGFHFYAIWFADYFIVGGYALTALGIVNFGPFA